MTLLFESVLRKLLASSELLEEDVFFVPPDQAWRTFVDTTDAQKLNVYLIELRENRQLRKSTSSAPRRVDCHYLISAWRKAATTVNASVVSQARHEAQLLFNVVKKLLNHSPLVPAEVLGLADDDDGGWGDYSRTRIPTRVAPPEGFPKIPEFWGTIDGHPFWKPIVHLIATLPVDSLVPPAGPPVTTIVTDYERELTTETLIMVSGIVTVGGVPAEGARVTVSEGGTTLRVATTDGDGKYVVEDLWRGTFEFNVEIPGRNDPPRVIEVPSPSGEYDFKLV